MPVSVIGLGAGGHAKVVIEILQMDVEVELAGLLDSDLQLKGRSVLGVQVIGGDELLSELVQRGISRFFLGLGSVSSADARARLYDRALAHGLQPVAAIHPSAVLSTSSKIGPGATIMAGAIINASASIGANVIVNTGAIIEHDCILGDHVHVATGARLAGAVHVKSRAHIGAGATVRQSITIGEGAVVGAGAVVVQNIFPYMTVAGVPARELKQKGERADG